LDPKKCTGAPTIFIIADMIKLYPEKFYKQGLEIIVASTRRNVCEALSPEIKSLNYLNNILAKMEATRAGVEEAIMLNYDCHVAECTGDNIFIVKNKKLFTPPVESGILKGITRQSVLDIAKGSGMEASENKLTTADLFDADECFLTGTAAEIVPVVKIDSKVIGNGKPGEITFKLREKFGKLTETDGVRY
jgi:branched-chain amino acid aminotransferase